jgi:hypothetical protein
VRPSQTEGSVVMIVVAWELSWYRYEVDLGNEAAGVRVTEQGSELCELDPTIRPPTQPPTRPAACIWPLRSWTNIYLRDRSIY